MASGAIKFKTMKQEDIDKLLDDFGVSTVDEIDKKLRKITEKEWAKLSEEERYLLTKYTQTYKYLNDRLRGLKTDTWRPLSETEHDMPIITEALNKVKLKKPMVVRRGTDDYHMPEIGKMLSEVQVGDEFTDKAFLSTAAHRDKGFFYSQEMYIILPKGARGIFAEPFTHYNDHNCYNFEYDEIWNGKDKQQIGSEFEWIGQRGCRFKCIKKEGNRVYLQLIAQLA